MMLIHGETVVVVRRERMRGHFMADPIGELLQRRHRDRRDAI